MISMSIVEDVMKDELKRNLEMQAAYKKEIASLKKGKIITKKIRNREYYYLLYRVGEKVKTDYLGPKEKVSVDDLQKELNKRKHYEKTLKDLLSEEKSLRKVIRD
jgi:hypothetical protein